MADAVKLLSAWDERAAATTWVASDKRAFDEVATLRLLCIERLVAAAGTELPADLYHACIRLGFTLAQRAGSASLAAVALDGARDALDSSGHHVPELTWRAARAALVEGFVSHTRDESERALFASWEPPRCFVVVEGDLAAVTAGHPSAEADVLGAWAGRVAGALLVRGVRRAVVAGEGKAAEAVLQALADAGITCRQVAMASATARSR